MAKHPNCHPTTQMSLAQSEDAVFAGFQVSQIVLCAIFVCAIPFEYIGFAEFLYRVWFGKDRGHIWLRSSLFISSLFFTAYLGLVTAMAFATNVDVEFCDSMTKAYSCFYVLGVMSGFVFLLLKARLVGKFEVEDKTYQLIYKGALVGMLGMMPGGLALTAILAQGKITSGGRCVQVFPSWFIWVFGGLTAQLILVLAYLFLQPVRQSARFMGLEGGEMRRIYAKNAKISVVCTSASFTLFFLVYAPLHQLGEIYADEDSYRALAVACVSWDAVVVCLSTRLTTSIWLPNCVRTRFFKRTGSNSGQSPNAVGNFETPKPENDSLSPAAMESAVAGVTG
ncbi:hypothetical protein BASA82_000639 [Batrachochytrium salamandrivorans]|nr:hypothetical protein BASA82_000639 [Batrachochytrium salamandrivorans]